MEKPDLTFVDDDVAQYVEYLEACLSGVDELSKALRYASSILAKDIYKLCDGSAFIIKEGVAINQLSILRGDPKDKTFDQLMDVYSNFGKNITGIGNKGAKAEKNTGKFKPGDSFYENAMRDIKKNGSSGSSKV